jgi:hypothetical protein
MMSYRVALALIAISMIFGSSSGLLDVAFQVHEVNASTIARFGYGGYEPAKYNLYRIGIQNTIAVPLTNVTVIAELAEGIKLEGTRYSEEDRGILNVKSDPSGYDDTLKTNLTWNIGTLEPGEIKSILLEAFLRPCTNRTHINGTVIGYMPVGVRINESFGAKTIKEYDLKIDNRPNLKNNCPLNKNNISNIIEVFSWVLVVNNETKARFGIGYREPAKDEIYKITVHNNGGTRFSDVTVWAEMGKDMKFEGTLYLDKSRGLLDVRRDPIEYNGSSNTSLIWNIGTMEPDEWKSILMEASLKPTAAIDAININVTGYSPEMIKAKNAITRVIPACVWREKNGIQECKAENATDDEKITRGCVKECPDWAQIFG